MGLLRIARVLPSYSPWPIPVVWLICLEKCCDPSLNGPAYQRNLELCSYINDKKANTCVAILLPFSLPSRPAAPTRCSEDDDTYGTVLEKLPLRPSSSSTIETLTSLCSLSTSVAPSFPSLYHPPHASLTTHLLAWYEQLLDTLVKNGGYPFQLQVGTKEFLNELVRKFPERPPVFPGVAMTKTLEVSILTPIVTILLVEAKVSK
jgi:hypothetical protein